MTTHTPGPWFADKLQDRNAYNIFPAGASHALLTVAAPAFDGAHPYGQAAEANARLIAAAPALLAALQNLVKAEHDRNEHPGFASAKNYLHAVEAAKAAIEIADQE